MSVSDEKFAFLMPLIPSQPYVQVISSVLIAQFCGFSRGFLGHSMLAKQICFPMKCDSINEDKYRVYNVNI